MSIVGRVIAGRPVAGGQFVIEGAGENAGGRGFADAAHAGQNIGLMDAIELEGVLQRLDHGLLADQIGEARWPVFPRQHAIGGLCLAFAGDGRSLAEVEASPAGGFGLSSRWSSLIDPQSNPGRGRKWTIFQSRGRRALNGEGGRLDRNPPGLVGAASFRT